MACINTNTGAMTTSSTTATATANPSRRTDQRATTKALPADNAYSTPQIRSLASQARDAMKHLGNHRHDVPSGFRFPPVPEPPRFAPPIFMPAMFPPPLLVPMFSPPVLAPPALDVPDLSMLPPLPGPPATDALGRPLFAPDGSFVDWSTAPTPDGPPSTNHTAPGTNMLVDPSTGMPLTGPEGLPIFLDAEGNMFSPSRTASRS